MKRLTKVYLQGILVAALLAAVCPAGTASAACLHQQTSVPCDCCPAPTQPASCAAPCQLEAAGPAQVVIVKQNDRQTKPVKEDKTNPCSLFQQRLIHLSVVLFISQATAGSLNPPRLYLQSHNLRL